MATVEQQLREALTVFITASASRDSAEIGAALNRVLELEHQVDSSAPPMLRHYLERRSYQKALDFLNTNRPETETPQCGH